MVHGRLKWNSVFWRLTEAWMEKGSSAAFCIKCYITAAFYFLSRELDKDWSILWRLMIPRKSLPKIKNHVLGFLLLGSESCIMSFAFLILSWLCSCWWDWRKTIRINLIHDIHDPIHVHPHQVSSMQHNLDSEEEKLLKHKYWDQTNYSKCFSLG